jgi:hypothetical protein
MRTRCALFVLLLAGCASATHLDATQQTRTNPKAKTIADFEKRVEDYVTLRNRVEDTLKDLPKQADPATADRHQRALSQLIQQERRQARQGDLFDPAMQALVRELLRPVFSGKDGRMLHDEIQDNEYKGKAPLKVNARYPDDVPLSTMPPQILLALPKLPGELEYRFINTNLILFDPHAHIIVDYMERAYR